MYLPNLHLLVFINFLLPLYYIALTDTRPHIRKLMVEIFIFPMHIDEWGRFR